MTFNDIFKSNFMEKVSSFSVLDATLALGGALLLGMFIYFTYRKTFAGVMYSRPFNTSLVLLTMLTTFVILAVTTNVILSLGMVGALSIVRFRTAIKDPLDLVFLFWAIGAGIILGAGMLPLAFLGSFLVGTVLLLLQTREVREMPYILMMDLEGEHAEVRAGDLVRKRYPKCRLKSKTISGGEIELIYEVRLKNGDTGFMNELSGLHGVKNTTLVSYNGEYAA
ncbi:DUF4956 domain-containing protein [Anaerotalea alkaliphila]|uniref:DUF4956 domain-containing protein n=1 Tax=Anaerotalea alkaliphila TaxID=2662126 RepID=A0A7X5HUY6_9FIRM|nr:DUF4956 domain-containing protein [Anaerotalea alkaliphila]NDL67134.1 DUF4956 domain-containing protein [Anaerotalea alkaliphila]